LLVQVLPGRLLQLLLQPRGRCRLLPQLRPQPCHHLIPRRTILRYCMLQVAPQGFILGLQLLGGCSALLYQLLQCCLLLVMLQGLLCQGQGGISGRALRHLQASRLLLHKGVGLLQLPRGVSQPGTQLFDLARQLQHLGAGGMCSRCLLCGGRLRIGALLGRCRQLLHQGLLLLVSMTQLRLECVPSC
jgi:hypothetical protein